MIWGLTCCQQLWSLWSWRDAQHHQQPLVKKAGWIRVFMFMPDSTVWISEQKSDQQIWPPVVLRCFKDQQAVHVLVTLLCKPYRWLSNKDLSSSSFCDSDQPIWHRQRLKSLKSPSFPSLRLRLSFSRVVWILCVCLRALNSADPRFLWRRSRSQSVDGFRLSWVK